MATHNTETDNVEPPTSATPQEAAQIALANSRAARHHSTCTCMQFQHLYCNAQDALWQNALNRNLQAIHDLQP
jgi:hypothetical protein